MSIEATCKTQIKDKSALVEALGEIFGKGNIKTEKEGVSVKGYSSSRKPTVLVNIPGLIGTAGYVLQPDGTYELVYDSSDRRALSKVIPSKTKAGLRDPLAQVYAKCQIKKAMKSLRGRVVKDELDADGSIRMKIKLTAY